MAEHAPYTVTFKAGRDFDAPWIVVSANDPAQLAVRIDGLSPELLTQVATKAKQFANAKSMRLVPAPEGRDTPPASRPQDDTTAAVAAVQEAIPGSEEVTAPKRSQLGEPEQELPASATPKCEHGLRKFFPAGTYKGEPYQASWRCPRPKSDKDRCKSITA